VRIPRPLVVALLSSFVSSVPAEAEAGQCKSVCRRASGDPDQVRGSGFRSYLPRPTVVYRFDMRPPALVAGQGLSGNPHDRRGLRWSGAPYDRYTYVTRRYEAAWQDANAVLPAQPDAPGYIYEIAIPESDLAAPGLWYDPLTDASASLFDRLLQPLLRSAPIPAYMVVRVHRVTRDPETRVLRVGEPQPLQAGESGGDRADDRADERGTEGGAEGGAERADAPANVSADASDCEGPSASAGQGLPLPDRTSGDLRRRRGIAPAMPPRTYCAGLMFQAF
jgi:hypothetical protein